MARLLLVPLAITGVLAGLVPLATLAVAGWHGVWEGLNDPALVPALRQAPLAAALAAGIAVPLGPDRRAGRGTLGPCLAGRGLCPGRPAAAGAGAGLSRPGFPVSAQPRPRRRIRLRGGARRRARATDPDPQPPRPAARTAEGRHHGRRDALASRLSRRPRPPSHGRSPGPRSPPPPPPWRKGRHRSYWRRTWTWRAPG